MKKELKKLEKFARMFDPDIDVEFNGTWASNIQEKVVFAGPELDEEEVEACRYVYNVLGMEVPVHPVVFAFLHEIGHVMSGQYFTPKEVEGFLDDYYIQKEELLDDEDLELTEFLTEYWQLKVEKLANDWAIEYLKTVDQKQLNKITKMVFDYIETKKMKDAFKFNQFIKDLGAAW